MVKMIFSQAMSQANMFPDRYKDIYSPSVDKLFFFYKI